jgi:hypothetical protein
VSEHLDPRLTVDSYEIIACVPHASRDQTWAVVGQADDCSYATLTASSHTSYGENLLIYDDVVEALSAMLRLARS